jgi:uncharacterized damage-inducible protein DinB
MGRIVGTPERLRLDQILHEELAPLRTERATQDAALIELVDGMEAAHFDGDLAYRNTRGEPFATPLRVVFGHLFNHQTHHRGQAHDVLTQPRWRRPNSISSSSSASQAVTPFS